MSTIYVISNVEYPERRKIRPGPEDMLVFLNTARSASFYLDCPVVRVCYHRSPEKQYGEPVIGCINNYVFDAYGLGYGIGGNFVDELKRTYDWDYPIEPGKTRCMTTGYMVVRYLQSLFPAAKIVLVNFGFEVKNSTYRCPWHNWKFEAVQLQNFEHIYLEEK